MQWRIAMLGATFAVLATGCTIVYPAVDVGPSFRVKVTDQGRPVQGLRIQLGGSDSATTDADGVARFSGVSPGNYLLTAHDDAGIPDAVTAVVKQSGPTGVTVPLRWPNGRVVAVRSASGTLRGPDYLPARLSLSLLEAVTGRVLADGQSDGSGRFSFAGVRPGLYFLRVNSGSSGDWKTLSGLIPLDIRPDAGTPSVDLDLGMTSCGLSFVDARECRQPEIILNRLCGHVADSTGGVIGDASVFLFDNGDQPKMIESTRSDRSGGFLLQTPADGTYQLVVIEPGFSPLNRVVQILGGTSEGCPHALRVKMEVAGGCSTVE
jgi:hypothetical protein